MEEVPRIYCINLKKSMDRRKRMENRFKNCNLNEKITFIDAVSRDSPLIDYYHQFAKQEYGNTFKWRSEMGCFASHLKAIRTFLEDGGEECLICEDDIMLRNNFIEEYNKIRSNMLQNTPFIALSYMVCKWEGYTWSGIDSNKHNICKINEKETWGMQLYWMSKNYAIEMLTKFDKPYRNENYIHTSEVVIRDPRGFIAYPPLAIEESVDSERAPEDLPYHRNHFNQWGKHNFMDAEKEVILTEQQCVNSQ